MRCVESIPDVGAFLHISLISDALLTSSSWITNLLYYKHEWITSSLILLWVVFVFIIIKNGLRWCQITHNKQDPCADIFNLPLILTTRSLLGHKINSAICVHRCFVAKQPCTGRHVNRFNWSLQDVKMRCLCGGK
jgi:hypothetical protein